MAVGFLFLAKVLAYGVKVIVERCGVGIANLSYFFHNRVFHDQSPINSSGEQKIGH